MEFLGNTYLALPLAAFKAESELQCDVFIYLRTNGRMVRLAKRGQVFDSERIAAYAQRGVTELHILDPLKEAGAYEFRADAYNPELPEAYRNGAVNVTAYTPQEGVPVAAHETTDETTGETTRETTGEATGEAKGETTLEATGEIPVTLVDEGAIGTGTLEAAPGTALDFTAGKILEKPVDKEVGEQTFNPNASETEPEMRFGKSAKNEVEPEMRFGKSPAAEDEPELRFSKDKEVEEKHEIRFSGGTKTENERKFGGGLGGEGNQIRVKGGKEEKAPEFEKRFKADAPEEEEEVEYVFSSKEDKQPEEEMKVKSLGVGMIQKGGRAGKGMGETGGELGRAVGSQGEGGGEAEPDTNKMIGKPRKNRPALAQEEEVFVFKQDGDDPLTAKLKAANETIAIQSSKAEKVTDSSIRRAMSAVQAFENQSPVGRKLNKMIAEFSPEELKHTTIKERMALERASFLERELNEHASLGNEITTRLRENPTAITEETYAQFTEHAKFIVEKTLLAKKAAAKLRDLRETYLTEEKQNPEVAPRTREAMAPLEEGLLKISQLDETETVLPKDIKAELPDWLVKSSPTEAPFTHIERIVKGIQELVNNTKPEFHTFVQTQNSFRKVLEIEHTEKAVEVITNRTPINRGNIYCSSLAVLMAVGLGYNEPEFLDEVATLALLRLEGKTRKFSKVPDHFNASLATLENTEAKSSIAYRDLRDILRIVEPFAAQNSVASFRTPLNALTSALASISSPEINPDNRAQALNFLKLRAADRASELSRKAAVQAGASVAGWV